MGEACLRVRVLPQVGGPIGFCHSSMRGWLPFLCLGPDGPRQLRMATQERRGSEAIHLPPLSYTTLCQAPIGLQCPEDSLPTRVGVYDPPGGGGTYSAATGCPFAQPITARNKFFETWKETAQPLEVGCGQSYEWPLFTAAILHVQSCPPLVDTIDWKRPLTFIVLGDAYRCARSTWSPVSIGLRNNGTPGRKPTYLWVIGMAVCGDKDMAAPPTIWAQVLADVWPNFCGLLVAVFA